MSNADALMAALQAEATALQGLGKQIAAELGKGRAASIIQVDILRPEIMRRLAALNQLLVQCGHVPPAERAGAFFDTVNTMRAEANRWSACDQIIAQQLPPRARPLTSARGAEPTQTSTLLAVMDDVTETGMDLSLSELTAALHGAYRVLLTQGRAAGATVEHLGCRALSALTTARAFFADLTAAVADAARMAHPDGVVLRQGRGTEDTVPPECDLALISMPPDIDDGPAHLQRILSTCSPGTLVLIADSELVHNAAELGAMRLMPHLFVIGLSRDEATALAEDATFTGVAKPPRKAITSPLWQALFDVSAARGFHPSPPGTSFIT